MFYVMQAKISIQRLRLHFASDRVLIYCGMVGPALSVDVFTGFGACMFISWACTAMLLPATVCDVDLAGVHGFLFAC